MAGPVFSEPAYDAASDERAEGEAHQCQRRCPPDEPLCVGEREAKEDDVAGDVRHEHMSQGQVAQCIDQTGDERHQHHGGGEQPVFVILAGNQRASCLCQMQVHVVDGPSVCSFCLSDALAHVRGERNPLRHDTRRGAIHGLSRFRHGVRVRSSSVSREKPPAVIGSGASHDYVVRRMSRLTGRSQAFTRSMPDCTSASTESQDLMKAATPSASSLSVTSLRLMPSSASLLMTAWDSS